MSIKTSADWFEQAKEGRVALIKSAKKKWKGTKDGEGNTALMLVSSLPGNAIFDLLIPDEAGNTNNEGQSALSIAVLANQIDKVQRLAPLEGSMVLDRGCTALIYAASLKRADMVPLLVPYSVIDQRNSEGYTALDIAVTNGDIPFVNALTKASRVNIDVLDSAIRRSLGPDGREVSQILLDYRAATYPNADPFDGSADPSSRTMNVDFNPQGTMDMDYITSNFGDAGRSTSLIDMPGQQLQPSTSTPKFDTKSQKAGKSSLASSKSNSIRKSPKLESASFTSQSMTHSVARLETPAPEDDAQFSLQTPLAGPTFYNETYAKNVTASSEKLSNSELQYSMTPNEIATGLGSSRSASQSLVDGAGVSRLKTPTSSAMTDRRGSQSISPAPIPISASMNMQGSMQPYSYPTNPSSANLPTRSVADSMREQQRPGAPDVGVAQLHEIIREKQAMIDDLKHQTMKLNKDLVETKRSLHKAELASGPVAQGHWATQSAVDRTNQVITDMHEQVREMKTDAIRAKNFFASEREKLTAVISEKTQRIAVLESSNRSLEATCDKLRAANKDLIEQITKKTTDNDLTAMLIAQKDAEIGELRDHIKELEEKVVDLTSRLASRQKSASQSVFQNTGVSLGTEDERTSQGMGEPYARSYSEQGTPSTKLSAGPEQGLSLQEVIRQLTAMNNSKDIVISELRSELANLRNSDKQSQRSTAETNRSKIEDQTTYDLRLAFADLQARHDALAEDNVKTIEKLRVRTRELQGLMEEIENDLPMGSMGTQIDLTRIKALLKVKNRDIAELKESALSTASRHAATCKAINAENERLNAALKRKDSEISKLRFELSTAHDFRDHAEGVRSENSQLMKEMKRIRTELEKHENIHPELAKYEAVVKSLGEENDTMKRMLRKRKEQIEYLKNGGDPSLLHTIGTKTIADKTQTTRLSINEHTDLINRDDKGNDIPLVKKLTEEVNTYSDKVTELSRLIVMKDAEISTLRKQTTDGATYKDLLCLLNEKMRRVDELHSDVEQRDREISKLVNLNRTGTPRQKGITENMHKSSTICRFYSHNEVKDLLRQLSDKEAEIAVLKSENMNYSYEKIHNLDNKFNVVKIENLEDKVAILNAYLADRDGTIERLQSQLQDAELALQSHRANIGLIGIGGVMGSDVYSSQRDPSVSPGTIISPELSYSKSLEASNAILQQKLADSKLKVADAQQELDWAQMRMNSMHDDLQKYKSIVDTMTTPTGADKVAQPRTAHTPLSGMDAQRPAIEPRNQTPTYVRSK